MDLLREFHLPLKLLLALAAAQENRIYPDGQSRTFRVAMINKALSSAVPGCHIPCDSQESPDGSSRISFCAVGAGCNQRLCQQRGCALPVSPAEVTAECSSHFPEGFGMLGLALLPAAPAFGSPHPHPRAAPVPFTSSRANTSLREKKIEKNPHFRDLEVKFSCKVPLAWADFSSSGPVLES